MPYRQKQAATKLAVLCLVALTLVTSLIWLNPQTMRELFPPLVLAGLATILALLLAHFANVIAAKRAQTTRVEDERDALIELTGRRNGHWFATVGLSLVVIQCFRGVSIVGVAETAICAFLISEAVVYGSRLYYYGRGL